MPLPFIIAGLAAAAGVAGVVVAAGVALATVSVSVAGFTTISVTMEVFTITSGSSAGVVSASEVMASKSTFAVESSSCPQPVQASVAAANNAPKINLVFRIQNTPIQIIINRIWIDFPLMLL